MTFKSIFNVIYIVSNKSKHFKAANFQPCSAQENIALIFAHVVCCLHYNFLLSWITMLLYISVYHEFIKRALLSGDFAEAG